MHGLIICFSICGLQQTEFETVNIVFRLIITVLIVELIIVSYISLMFFIRYP
jgi:hypothetical protein